MVVGGSPATKFAGSVAVADGNGGTVIQMNVEVGERVDVVSPDSAVIVAADCGVADGRCVIVDGSAAVDRTGAATIAWGVAVDTGETATGKTLIVNERRSSPLG